MALSQAAQQVEWMYSSLNEIGILPPRPANLRADNQATICIASNQTGSAKVKHIDVCKHYVRDKVDRGLINLDWIESSTNITDMLMKPLNRIMHWKHYVALRLCEPDDPLIIRSTN